MSNWFTNVFNKLTGRKTEEVDNKATFKQAANNNSKSSSGARLPVARKRQTSGYTPSYGGRRTGTSDSTTFIDTGSYGHHHHSTTNDTFTTGGGGNFGGGGASGSWDSGSAGSCDSGSSSSSSSDSGGGGGDCGGGGGGGD